jgi:kynurenine formamidase
MNRSRQIVDLSHPLSVQTPAFPGDPQLEIKILDSSTAPISNHERHLNCSQLSMCLHCGTHMDAPFHFFEDGATIDCVALETCIGPAIVVRLPPEMHQGVIDAKGLQGFEAKLRAVPRVIFNTSWHHRWGADDYFTAHPLITGDAARLLVDCGVRLVGVDTPSVDRPPFEAHLTLLGAGVLIIENLTNLDAIPGDEFELVATPLAVVGRDGSPVRAVAVLTSEQGTVDREQ